MGSPYVTLGIGLFQSAWFSPVAPGLFSDTLSLWLPGSISGPRWPTVFLITHLLMDLGLFPPLTNGVFCKAEMLNSEESGLSVSL